MSRSKQIGDKPVAAGATAYCLLTDYELVPARVITMPAHEAMDAAGGALPAASPWLFDFAAGGPRYRLPHAIVGAAEIPAALTTKTR